MSEINSTAASREFKVGVRFGRWIIIGESVTRGKWLTRHWLCRCDCGTERHVSQKNMARGKSTGCRHCRYSGRFTQDAMIGRRSGTWTVERFVGSDLIGENLLFECRCECGAVATHTASRLRTRRAKKCRKCEPHLRGSKVQRHFWAKVHWAARKRNLVVDVEIEQALEILEKQNFRCVLTGLEIGFAPTLKDHMKGGTTVSLDRIESGLGYCVGNVQWVHKDVNKMKWEFAQARFIELCRLVADKHK